MRDKAQRFRQLHESCFVIGNAWDAGSARILAGLGYQALATSSAAHAGTLGKRDGHVTRDEALEHAKAEGLVTLDNGRGWVAAEQQKAVTEFVRSGKGVVVAHAGLDALYGFEEYREMVGGGLFEEHPWTRSVRINVEDHENTAVSHLGDGFWIRDEIYVLDENPRWNSHVLTSLDMASVGVPVGSGDATRDDYPMSWLRRHGEGRVFATKLGHFGDVWRNPAFLQHLLSGMRQAAGREPADFSCRRVKEKIAENVWPDDLAIAREALAELVQVLAPDLQPLFEQPARFDELARRQVVADVPVLAGADPQREADAALARRPVEPGGRWRSRTQRSRKPGIR